MSNTIPAVGDRVRFIEDYGFARAGYLGEVTGTRPVLDPHEPRATALVTVRLDGSGRTLTAFDFRMEVVAKPVVGERYVVTADGEASGLRHYYDLGEVVECISLDVRSATYALHEDAAEFKSTTGRGKRQTVRLVDLKPVAAEPEPEAPAFAKGDEVRVEEANYRVSRGTVTRPHYEAERFVGKVGQVYDGVPDADGDIEVEFPDGSLFPFDPAGLVKVEPEVAKPAPHGFEVGDRVVFIDAGDDKPMPWFSSHGTRFDTDRQRYYSQGATAFVVTKTEGFISSKNIAVKPEGGFAFDVDPAIVRHSVEDPEVHAFEPGDRAVVTGTVFYRYGAEMGDHENYPHAGRPQVGDVVTIGNYASAFPGNLDVGGWALAAECLVPASKFVPGDRVEVVGGHYVGVYRSVGNVGTVVATDRRPKGIRGADYAVVLDGNGSTPWGYRESDLALVPAPLTEAEVFEAPYAPEPLAEWERELLSMGSSEVETVRDEVTTFSEGDRVKVVGLDFIGEDRDHGKVGTVISGPDADGDYRVTVPGEVNYFAASSLALVAEEPVAAETPEDYTLRLEVSAKAADILSKAGFRNIYGSDVSALAEFLLGVAKREA